MKTDEKTRWNAVLEGSCSIFEMEQLLKKYPYVEILRLNYLKQLRINDEAVYAEKLNSSGIYFYDRSFAYFFCNSSADRTDTVLDTALVSDNYFALDNHFSRESLRDLAKKLKQAREEKKASLDDNLQLKPLEVSEDNAIRLIKEKQYLQALKVLKQLNLIMSEKSVYFVAQIKFLEAVVK